MAICQTQPWNSAPPQPWNSAPTLLPAFPAFTPLPAFPSFAPQHCGCAAVVDGWAVVGHCRTCGFPIWARENGAECHPDDKLPIIRRACSCPPS